MNPKTLNPIHWAAFQALTWHSGEFLRRRCDVTKAMAARAKAAYLTATNRGPKV